MCGPYLRGRPVLLSRFSLGLQRQLRGILTSPFPPCKNSYFISLEDLIQEGVLTEAECSQADFGSRPDFGWTIKVHEERYPPLEKKKAHERAA